MSYPVTLNLDVQFRNRSRLTAAFRPILAIPHAILAGPIYWSIRTGGVGLLGAAAYFLAFVSWCSLLVTGREPAGVREFGLFYLRWRTRSLAYLALFRDEYPPFGDGPHPVTVAVEPPSAPRHHIGLRPLLLMPHLLVLWLLLVAWLVTTVIAWFSILIAGVYPPVVAAFGVGVMRWTLRVEAYALLLVDEYPPFTLQEHDVIAGGAGDWWLNPDLAPRR
jgi:hypothetical protein